MLAIICIVMQEQYICRLSCDCDRQLYQCLHAEGDNDKVASAVGLMYFDKLVKKCFNFNNSTMTATVVETPKYRVGNWNTPSFG